MSEPIEMQRPESALEAARLILQAVAPANHAVIWVIACWQGVLMGREPPPPRRTEEVMGRLHAARDALAGGIAEMLTDLHERGVYRAEPRLVALRADAAAALTVVIETIEDGFPHGPIPEALKPAVEAADRRVSEYLQTTEIVLRDAHHTARDEARREADAALEEISEVSFRIGMVSLNASIEAANAGPAGRGFAAIAEEVRTLSRRCESLLETAERSLTRL